MLRIRLAAATNARKLIFPTGTYSITSKQVKAKFLSHFLVIKDHSLYFYIQNWQITSVVIYDKLTLNKF
ncbi:g010 [Yersinia phage phiR1-37]|uniref:hypothetical protein n=1 Tax=Yersinia phage phiR1-37 TaxID=331278 RepID=UPI00022DBCB6|nr:hypothetical protein phiR1-37_gp010 [Yersinia phage phiR1-37]CCE26034.1 g010 [Yersinia phage phiR1-37]